MLLRAAPPKKGKEPPPDPFDGEDPMALFKQLMGEMGQQGPGGANPFQGLPGMGGFPGMPGAPGMGGMNPGDPFGGMMGGAQQKKASDSFFTDRIPLLQKIKKPVLVVFFSYCFWKGWIGKWGLLSAVMLSLTKGSYFDMLAVPARILPRSPFHGWMFVTCQFYVEQLIRLTGFLVNVARGKDKLPTMSDLTKKWEDMANMAKQPPGASPFGAQGSPWASPGASPWASMAPPPPSSLTEIPTAPTTTIGTVSSSQLPRPTPGRTPPPIIDAEEVKFLD